MPGFKEKVKKWYLKKSGEKGASAAKMDDANRALCYAWRHPGPGKKPMKYKDIQKLVRKTDGRRPRIAAIALAAATFKDVKGKRGRPKGTRNTSKAEDKKILKTFFKVRPPGQYVDSRIVRNNLPLKLQDKASIRTVGRSCGVCQTAS